MPPKNHKTESSQEHETKQSQADPIAVKTDWKQLTQPAQQQQLGKRAFSESTTMAPPTGTHLPASPLALLKSRGFLLKTSLPEPLPSHRYLPGGCDKIYKALTDYTTYYFTLKRTFSSSMQTRNTQLHVHLKCKAMPFLTFMLEKEALLQYWFDTHLALLKEMREFLPVLGEPTPLPGLLEFIEDRERDLLQKRASAMMVIRAQCVVAARAVSPVSEDEEEVTFRERFLGKGDEVEAKKSRVE
ncbi:hypothetical protein FKW77_000868 [Venturia effusa]|uniref:Uncharacterized protein n=1 Tax=Venturia effusa TaxID=50376 RepID=A0A517LAC5_9PEZI|nr:hypothetical protein FKW77_000868 [Venturia effusa]